jgi:hypothetical protein
LCKFLHKSHHGPSFPVASTAGDSFFLFAWMLDEPNFLWAEIRISPFRNPLSYLCQLKCHLVDGEGQNNLIVLAAIQFGVAAPVSFFSWSTPPRPPAP